LFKKIKPLHYIDISKKNQNNFLLSIYTIKKVSETQILIIKNCIIKLNNSSKMEELSAINL